MIIHFIVNGTSVTLAKISKIISDSLPIATETTELTLKNISSEEKLLLLLVYGVIAVIFSIFVFLIIYALEKINKKRAIEEGRILKEEEEIKERVINIPFILIIIVYIVVMAIII